MIIQTTKRFDRDYAKLPKSIRSQAEKQLALLMENPHHPSLGIRKMKGHSDLWEGRVTIHYRFVFRIIGEVYWLNRIGTHDIYKNP